MRNTRRVSRKETKVRKLDQLTKLAKYLSQSSGLDISPEDAVDEATGQLKLDEERMRGLSFEVGVARQATSALREHLLKYHVAQAAGVDDILQLVEIAGIELCALHRYVDEVKCWKRELMRSVQEMDRWPY